MRQVKAFDDTEVADLIDAVAFARRGIERLLSAGYPLRTNASDKHLLKREARYQELLRRLREERL